MFNAIKALFVRSVDSLLADIVKTAERLENVADRQQKQAQALYAHADAAYVAATDAELEGDRAIRAAAKFRALAE